MEKIEKFSDAIKYETNPFIEQSLEIVSENITRKYQRSSGQSQQAILHAIDENGKVIGHTTFVRQIQVDEQQFVKIYLSRFEAFFNLSQCSIRIFGYILNNLKPNQDMILFDIDKCKEYTKYKTVKPIYKGLTELIESEIVARSKFEYVYYINPMIFFNGNRITFAESYIKKQDIENVKKIE